MRPMEPRRVVILVFSGVQTLDVAGPAEVFAMADRIAGGAYAVELVAKEAGEVRTSSGLSLLAGRTFADCRGPLDTLVAAGGAGVAPVLEDDPVVGWLRAAAARSRRVASVCNGAFLLARAGLLEGRRATTHWAACEELARLHPGVRVERDPIYVRDGRVYTSAGVTAGIDLALGLVEEDLGAGVALEVARWLVLFLQRPGGQSQFSTHLSSRPAGREPLRELQAWIPDHLHVDLSVPALAERAHMSPRNFARTFGREVGVTPAAYVEALRVERARLELETTAAGVDEIARRCGFGTVETMRRAFRRRLRVSPIDYRQRFRPRGAPNGHRHPAL